MQEGLKIIQLPGRYGYSVTRVGFLRRVSGDEWTLHDARTLERRSGSRRIDQLASDGPGKDHDVSEASKTVEEVHRLSIRRALQADPRAWAKYFDGGPR